MSGGTKQQFKQFSITCAEDACLVLGMLISGMTVNLEKYKEYASEAESLLESTQEEYVPAKEYDDVYDKLLYRQREILKFTADHQSSSFSYIDLRKILEKHKYVSSPLSEEVSAILSEFLDVRNWTFHNPQSLMVAAKEVAHKDIPDELKEIAQVTPQLNPVLIRKICRYELVMLASLTIHAQKRIEQFEKVLRSMKTDYQEIYDSIENKPFLMTAHGLSDRVQYGSDKTAYEKRIEEIIKALRRNKNRQYYIAAFPFFNEKNAIVYDLIHCTSNLKGFQLYKKSAWQTFGGKSSTKNTHGNENQVVLDFEGNGFFKTVTDEFCYYIKDIAEYLQTRFDGQDDVPLDDLWAVLDEHPVFPSDGFRNDIKNELKQNYGASVSRGKISFARRGAE